VESRRIEKIVSLLHEHGRLSSVQLSRMIGLSRTRCNEYFKKMEELGLVEGVMVGKEKYYKLKE
jgi:DNA-binding Lrp family transcriptional regulator